MISLDQLSPERRALLALRALRKRREGQETTSRLTIPALPREGGSQTFPLSFAQERLWFLDQLVPGSSGYNVPAAVRLHGVLNTGALLQSINEIVRRHESLRTTFATSDGQPMQVVHPSLELSIPIIDLRQHSDIDDEAHRLALAEARRPFDLANGPLIRATLLQLAEQDHVVLLTLHHIVSDNWSLNVFVREMAVLYDAFTNGRTSPLAELPVQYADYASWRRDSLQGEALETQLSYWKQKLGGDLPSLELPTDRTRPAVQSLRGDKLGVSLPKTLSAQLKALAEREGATLYMAVLATFKTLLSRYTGQTDILVGMPIANRNRSELEGLIGFFVDTLVLRTDLSGDPAFRELLGRVREVAVGAYANGDVPFERLVDALEVERDLSRQPLFQAMCVLQTAPQETMELGGLKLEPFETSIPVETFDDINLSLTETPEGLTGTFEYNADLFEAETIVRMAAQFETLLTAIVADPDQKISTLPLLTAHERRQLLVDWNATTTDDLGERCVHEMFEAQVERTPDSVAVLFGDQKLTYRELNDRANQLAHHLRQLGVGPEVRAGILLERSLEMTVAVLGALKAGGTYVPIDASYPLERVSYVLEDAQMQVLLTQEKFATRGALPVAQVVCLDSNSFESFSTDNVASGVTPDNLLYVIYTSGSTGKPKGVALAHRPLANLLNWHLASLLPAVNTLQFASLSFDASFHEMFAAWCSGGTLHVISEEVRRDAVRLAQYIAEEKIEKVILPVVVLQQLAEGDVSERQMLRGLREITTTGEQLHITRPIKELFEELSGCPLHNHYGPSETHVVTAATMGAEIQNWKSHPPIGTPISNTQMYVLDQRMEPVPIGVIGEVFIGGISLARGYLNRPELTAEKFIPDPHSTTPGARLYKTGDLGRYLPDSQIEFLGRRDHQVKIRGFRVELGEIESMLDTHSAVREVVVLAREDVPGEKQLVAYLVAEPGREPSTADLRAYLRERLPEYMVPSAFVLLNALPLTSNGKVDRRALPAPQASRAGSNENYVAPGTEVEEKLAAIWSEVLHVERVGIHDNFFELGGDSIRCMKTLARAKKAGLRISLKEFFDGPTISELATVAECFTADLAEQATPASLPKPNSQHNGEIIYPLSPMQQGMLFHSLYAPAEGEYTEQFSWELRGDFNVEAFRQAWQQVIERHDVLRTSFSWEDFDEPVQVVQPGGTLPLDEHDWRNLSAAEQQTQLATFIRISQQTSLFDLNAAPLMRVSVLHMADELHHIVWSYHHLLLDGWSQALVLQEVQTIYEALCENREPQLEERRPFRDYISWLQQQDLTGAEVFWRRTLKGYSAPISLGARQLRGTEPESFELRQAVVSESVSRRLSTFARQHGLTLNTIIQGAWALLLSRYSGEHDVVFGNVVAGRPAELEGVESTIGMFINTLPVRVQTTSEAALLPWLKQLQSQQAEARQYEFSPLAQVQRWSDVPPEMRLFENFLIFENYPGSEAAFWNGEDWPALQTGYPLYAMVRPGERLSLKLIYSTRQFSNAAITRMLGHFETLLASMLVNPTQQLSDISLLTAAEQQQLLVDWNQTDVDLGLDVCFVQRFEAQVEETPDRVAIVAGDRRLTYRELNEQSNRLGRLLVGQGVGPDVVVALLAPRGLTFVTAMLAVFKAGGAYIPLNPNHPARRHAQVLEQSKATLVLATEEFATALAQATESLTDTQAPQVLLVEELFKQSSASNNLPVRNTPSDLAYVIYTSGSTGTPKGVMIEHLGMLNHLCIKVHDLKLTAADVVVQNASQCFDISVWQYLAALLVGGRVEVFDDEVALDPVRLLDAVEDQGVTVLETVPSMLRAMLDELDQREVSPSFAALRCLISNAEALPYELCSRWYAHYQDIVMLNTWGATECSDDVTHLHLEAGEGSELAYMPLGFRLPNIRVYIVDEQMRPVPIGVVGELCIAGISVGRGYLNDEERTQRAFIEDPFREERGQRLYRTGDLGRYLDDGNIEFIGRIDDQVKIRGYRVELGEIEAALREHRKVDQVVVLARDEAGQKQLVAYVVGLENDVPAASELRNYAQERLPDYMVPAAFVLLEAMPLTVNGKVDRRALPAPTIATLAETYRGPSTQTEEILAGIWSQVLGLEQIGVDDNFFALGGHSLLATQVVSRINHAFQIEVPLRSLFERGTIAALAEQIEALTSSTVTTPALVRRDSSGSAALSFAQQRLWFIDQLEPNNPFYNVPAAVRLSGELDVDALERTLSEIVRRHEVLRTTFPTVNGEPVQVISESTAVELNVIDLRDSEERESEARRLAAKEAQRPFDLSRGPLLRSTLVQLDEREFVVLLTMHHIVSDGWSIGVLVREVAALYEAFVNGQDSPLPELAIQYSDYAAWQREWLQGEVLDGQLGYWREHLTGAPAVLELPTDHPRPAVQTFRGALEWFSLSTEVTEQINRLSREQSVTPFMTLLAAFQVLLSRYSGQSDICVGTPIANRTRVETESLIGFFVNTLVLRTEVQGELTVKELLRRVREVTLNGYAHQDVPFERLVEELAVERSLSHSPLFQVMLVLQNAPAEELTLPGLSLRVEDGESETARFDLTLSLTERDGQLLGAVEYSSDLFEQATIQRMMTQFERLLSGMAEDVERRVWELPLLSEAERHEVVVEWNETRQSYEEESIATRFARQVEQNPAAIAVEYEGARVSYGELNARANQLAHHLQSLGVGVGSVVGLCLERSLEMAVSLLAVLKAGAAYLPLDPEYPQDRLSFMLSDAATEVLLTQQRLLERLPEHQARVVCVDADNHIIDEQRDVNPFTQSTPEDLTYVIYTSGSTGRPKGVAMPQRPLINLLEWQLARSASKPQRTLQFTSLSFDVSFQEIFSTWLSGGTLVLIDAEVRRDAGALLRVLRDEQIERLFLPFVALQYLAESAEQEKTLPTSLREVITAGEQLKITRHLRRLFNLLPDCKLDNQYGPSESHVASACMMEGAAMSWPELPTIGRPIANTQLYVLDKWFQPVPVGVSGELYIGGKCLAQGYLQRPEISAEKFVPDPFSTEGGTRLYRTGDLARYLPDGNLEFLGRCDQQVKIRGFRIELGEVEAALRQHTAVRETVVTVASDSATGSKRLVAYVLMDQDHTVTTSVLRDELRQKLPDYMIPTAFVVLDQFPLTPSGKVNRRALPAPESVQVETTPASSAPRTPTEELLCGIWAEVIGIGQVGIHDNFFSLGGHSLLSTQMVSRVREALQVDIAVRSVFETPTVAGLAEQIELLKSSTVTTPALVRRDSSGSAALSFAQQRLWFIDQLEPNNPFYNVPAAVRLSGDLDVDALQRTLSEIVRRHEVLRTTFPTVNGEPVQVISESTAVELTMIDLRESEERESEARRLAAKEAQRPFDLSRGPLLRSTLVQLEEREFVVLLTMHHIVSDGWSIGVLVREVAALYEAFVNGQSSPLPELAIQYSDYAAWQREWLQGEVLDGQLGYWREHLTGAPAVLELPTDHPRPAVQTFRGALEWFSLSSEVTEQINRLSREQSVTPFMTLLAAFQVLLSRYSGQNDICVGTPIANRTRVETESLIGFFVNTLVLRTEVQGELTVKELLRRVREVTLNGYAHQDVPFERLVEELAVERSLSHSPLFQVMLVLQNAPAEELSLPGLSLRVEDGESETARFDLTLSLTERDGQLLGAVEYSSDLFEQATIQRMMQQFERLLSGMAEDVERRVWELPLLSEAERHEVVVEWNETRQSYEEESIATRFARQVEQNPAAIAVEYEGARVSYGELNARANQLAHHLQSLGVGVETPVGILMDRSIEMIVSLIGILKAGGVYVPLDPTYPQPRLAFMIEDAGVKTLLTQQRWIELVSEYALQVIAVDADWPEIAIHGDSNPPSSATADNLAYIIYTSGSTGIAKGASIPQRAVLRLISQPNYATLDAEQVFLLAAPLTFDASTLEVWGALLNGGRLVVYPAQLLTLSQLGQHVRQYGVTTLWLTAGLFHLMVDEHLDDLRGVKQLLAGGDVLSVPHVTRVLRELPGCRLINGYGPTENTTFTCCYPMDDVDQVGATVSIGRPITNTQVYVLDEFHQVVPVGGVGELYIGGDGLARGYLNQTEMTAERFVPDSVSGAAGARLYRTGDRVRYLADGRIEFLGRVDHQVKLRGFRIEPGEIETILNQHPAVREAVVVTREDAPGDKRLVAYLVPAAQAQEPNVFRQYLSDQLPEYMVPSAFVLLESLPLTANGKVDRRALPAPTLNTLSESYRAPVTQTEEILAGIWSQVLGVDKIGVDDNFFSLGGHSLLATQVVSRISQAFQLEVPLRSLFERGTIAALAAQIETLKAEAVGIAAAPPLVRRERHAAPALSFAQQRLWFIDQLEPNNPFYNVPAAVRLSGDLNISALQRTLSEIVRRHEALRTTFSTVDGEPVQVINESMPVELTVIDLRESEAAESEARRLAAEESQRPFDLGSGPLLRSTLLQVSETEYVVLLMMHHIISDGWSMGVLVGEVAALYEAYVNGEESPLPELAIQYADFAAWQREWLQGEVLERQLGYWREQLSGAPAVLELPLDHPRPAIQTFRGASQPISFSNDLSEQIRQLSQREGVTVFMTLLAAFQVLLSRYSRQRDICVGTPVANRNRLETESLIGFFVNTLVLRSSLRDGLTFRELLQQVREVTLSGYSHQDVPFEKLVEELQPERSLSHSPLFQVMFGLLNAPQDEFELPGLKISAVDGEAQTAKFDLNMSLAEFGPVMAGALEYNRDLFDAATAKRMVEHFENLLQAVIANPEQRISELTLIGEAERRQLLVEWNDTTKVYPQDKCLHQLFEDQVERTPDAIAIVFEEQQLSYRELNERANQLAHHLRSLGVREEVKVGVLMERSIEMVVSLYAILKAGGAYVPMDPEYPADRLAYMFTNSEVHVLLTQQRLLEHMPETASQVVCVDSEWRAIEAESRQNPSTKVTPQNLAYVIYTSGSTGRPKGSMIPHSGICNRLLWMQDAYQLGPDDTVLQKTPFSFDVSVWEFFWPLITGARLVVAIPGGHRDSGYLVDLIAEQNITVMHFVPSMLQVFLEEKQLAKCSSLKKVMCSGEALPFDLQERFFNSLDAELHNLYGPTEASVDVTFFECERESSRRIVPIGEPIANTQIYILDEQRQLVPTGVAGELHIGGDGLARGYLNRADLTANSFIPNPLSDTPGARLYKTGDLARCLADGKIEYLGRLDHQVKIRGFRIELGEIEASLSEHPAVRETVVIANESEAGEKRLAAYVVLSQEASTSDLRNYLRERLPEYMVPADFVVLEHLPLNPNGKVDRRALPTPERSTRSEETYVAPRTPVEQMLSEIWCEVLRTERLGVHDNFFDAGGHSLLATQILSRVRHAFQVDISVRDFFTSPTIDTLAKIIVQNQAEQAEQDDLAQMLAELEALSLEDAEDLLATETAEPN